VKVIFITIIIICILCLLQIVKHRVTYGPAHCCLQ